MTKAFMWCGALVGAAGGGYLGHAFVSWMATNPDWRVLVPGVSVGALVGALLGWVLGFVVAGLIEA